MRIVLKINDNSQIAAFLKKEMQAHGYSAPTSAVRRLIILAMQSGGHPLDEPTADDPVPPPTHRAPLIESHDDPPDEDNAILLGLLDDI